MKFEEGNKRGRGRPKGSPNRTGAEVKAIIEDCFDGIGGLEGLKKWARKNRTEFYKIYSKLLPKDLNVKTSHIAKSEPIPETNRWISDIIAARPADADKGTLPN